MCVWATVKTIFSRGISDDFEQFKMSSRIRSGNSFDCCPNTHETTVLLPTNCSRSLYLKQLTCLIMYII